MMRAQREGEWKRKEQLCEKEEEEKLYSVSQSECLC